MYVYGNHKNSPLSIVILQFTMLETTFRRLSFSSFILHIQFFNYLQSILSIYQSILSFCMLQFTNVAKTIFNIT